MAGFIIAALVGIYGAWQSQKKQNEDEKKAVMAEAKADSLADDLRTANSKLLAAQATVIVKQNDLLLSADKNIELGEANRSLSKELNNFLTGGDATPFIDFQITETEIQGVQHYVAVFTIQNKGKYPISNLMLNYENAGGENAHPYLSVENIYGGLVITHNPFPNPAFTPRGSNHRTKTITSIAAGSRYPIDFVSIWREGEHDTPPIYNIAMYWAGKSIIIEFEISPIENRQFAARIRHAWRNLSDFDPKENLSITADRQQIYPKKISW